MIELYYWPTPNGHKVAIMLEEIGADYAIKPINIGKGAQFNPEFLSIAPNNRIPAIIDHAPLGGGEPITLFESGAILEYLGEKSGLFFPQSPAKKYQVLQWLYWQMGGLGPMLGQNHHFHLYAPEDVPYAKQRYKGETSRLYQVMENRLAKTEYLGGEYSIADMAAYPWIVPHEAQQQDITQFPCVQAWLKKIEQRPAVLRAYQKGQGVSKPEKLTPEARSRLFQQSATSLKPNQ